MDHFGLRDPMIHWRSALAYRWLGEANPDVLIGRNERLFYFGNAAVAQSAGVTFRPELIEHTVDILTDMRKVLAARGVSLLVGAPPNAASIYDDDLPDWARRQGRETEPDRILTLLKARGLTVVDLRQALRAARGQDNLYRRTDTHWTLLGALLSYDMIVKTAGHADWAIRPEQIMGPSIPFGTGDLARMLGVGADLTEMTPNWTLRWAEAQVLGPPDADFQLTTGKHGGPAIFILGDSFTEGIFATLVAGHAARIGWLHNKSCGFDWSWIDTFKPDEVWWLPTERLMLCNPGVRPKGMPYASGSDDGHGRFMTAPDEHGSGGLL